MCCLLFFSLLFRNVGVVIVLMLRTIQCQGWLHPCFAWTTTSWNGFQEMLVDQMLFMQHAVHAAPCVLVWGLWVVWSINPSSVDVVCHCCHFGCWSLPMFADLRCIELHQHHQLELFSTLPSPFQALAIHHAAHCGAPALEALLARGFAVDHRPPLSAWTWSSFVAVPVTKIRLLNRISRYGSFLEWGYQWMIYSGKAY